ncbi:MAG: hypothetical protein ACRDZX_05715 [Acidimicrobiales bacterium]
MTDLSLRPTTVLGGFSVLPSDTLETAVAHSGTSTAGSRRR